MFIRLRIGCKLNQIIDTRWFSYLEIQSHHCNGKTKQYKLILDWGLFKNSVYLLYQVLKDQTACLTSSEKRQTLLPWGRASSKSMQLMWGNLFVVSLLELPWDQPTESCQEYADWLQKKTYLPPWKKIQPLPLSESQAIVSLVTACFTCCSLVHV